MNARPLTVRPVPIRLACSNTLSSSRSSARRPWSLFASICAAGITAATITGAAAVIEARARIAPWELAPWSPGSDAELCTWAREARLSDGAAPAWAQRIIGELVSSYTPDAVDYVGCAPW